MLRRLIAAAMILAVLGSVAGVAYASHDHGNGDGGGLDQVKNTLAQFRSLPVADGAGYKLLVDAKGIACIDMPGTGAMGVHYVKGALVGDGRVDPLTPEAVVYEPDGRGHMAPGCR